MEELIKIINVVGIYLIFLATNTIFGLLLYKKGNKILEDLRGDDEKWDNKELLIVIALIFLMAGVNLVMFFNVTVNNALFTILFGMLGVGVGGKLAHTQINKNNSKN